MKGRLVEARFMNLLDVGFDCGMGMREVRWDGRGMWKFTYSGVPSPGFMMLWERGKTRDSLLDRELNSDDGSKAVGGASGGAVCIM